MWLCLAKEETGVDDGSGLGSGVDPGKANGLGWSSVRYAREGKDAD